MLWDDQSVSVASVMEVEGLPTTDGAPETGSCPADPSQLETEIPGEECMGPLTGPSRGSPDLRRATLAVRISPSYGSTRARTRDESETRSDAFNGLLPLPSAGMAALATKKMIVIDDRNYHGRKSSQNYKLNNNNINTNNNNE